MDGIVFIFEWMNPLFEKIKSKIIGIKNAHFSIFQIVQLIFLDLVV